MTEDYSSCFICTGSVFGGRTNPYMRCRKCGHEVLREESVQGFIVNDFLDEADVHRITRLDRFKAEVLSRFDRGLDRKSLLDIGSASGKFLHHNGRRYQRAIGLEITPESVAFARGVMGLEIIEGTENIPDLVTVATAWHSLEHIPKRQLIQLLEILSKKIPTGGRFIVSVPSAASRQYKWFGRAYAYFDVPNHLHQFTPDSLARLMKRYDFHLIETVDSRPYNTFGYIQGMLNVLTRTNNYLYYRLKRRSRPRSLLLDVTNFLLLPLLVPAGWLLGALDSFTPEKQGVLTSCFEKKTS